MGEKYEVKGTQKGTKKNNEKVKGKTGQVQKDENNKEKGGGAKKAAVVAAAVTCGLAVSAAAAYTYMGLKYRDVFFPNTVINGLDTSGKTVDQVKQMIDDGMESYTLTIEERNGVTEQIGGDEIGLHSEYDGSLEKILADQEPLKWGFHLMESSAHTIETMIAYDEDRLDAVVNGLECMDESKTELPENAYLSEYRDGVGYEIVPEAGGTRVKPEAVRQGVADAIQNLQDRVSLDEVEAYEHALITAEDPALVAEAEKWNHYVNVEVAYQFGDETEILNGDTIHTWIVDNGEGGLELDEDKVAEYVDELATKYDTAYQPKSLKTAYGDTVTITGGNYGWRINRNAEAAALSEIIRSGKSQEREPIYSQTAASRGENDYGKSYVEVNLTAQHLYFYVDGELIVESDFVSGNKARGMSTPPGAYPLTYKQRNAVLRGPGYATPVSYWMPFNGGIGLHDAGWRGSFGGNIYKTNGSHGCINLPPSAARVIYDNISAGMPVLCYHLDGTSGGVLPASAQKIATVPAAAPPAAPATAPAPAAPETVPDPAATDPAQTEESQAGGENPAEGAGQETPAGPQEETPAGPDISSTPVVTGGDSASQGGPGVQGPSSEGPGEAAEAAGPGVPAGPEDTQVVESPGM